MIKQWQLFTCILLALCLCCIHAEAEPVEGWVALPPPEWLPKDHKPEPKTPNQPTQPKPTSDESIKLHNYPWITSRPRTTKEKVVIIKRKTGTLWDNGAQANLSRDIHFTMKVKNRKSHFRIEFPKSMDAFTAKIRMYNTAKRWGTDIELECAPNDIRRSRQGEKDVIEISQRCISTTLANLLTPGTESAHFRIRFGENNEIKGMIQLGSSYNTMNYAYIVQGSIKAEDILAWYKNPKDINGDGSANEKDMKYLLQAMTQGCGLPIQSAPPSPHLRKKAIIWASLKKR